jgi:hypothetical protein
MIPTSRIARERASDRDNAPAVPMTAFRAGGSYVGGLFLFRSPKKGDPVSAAAAIKFLESLKIPEGPLAGKPIRLAEFQKRFIRGALADGVSIAALSVGRGAGETMLGAGLGLGALLGKIDRQKRREVIIGPRPGTKGASRGISLRGWRNRFPSRTASC